MKEIRKCRFPFDDYYTREPSYHTKIKRYQLLLYPFDKNKCNTSVTYARYLYSVNNKIKLVDGMQVDHIDGDRTCDMLNNLQLLTANENKKKFFLDSNINSNKVLLKCPCCEIIFIRNKNKTHLSRRGKFTTCSRKCSGIIRQALQKNFHHKYSIDDIKRRIESNVLYEYKAERKVIVEKHLLEDWRLFTDEYIKHSIVQKEIKYCAVCKNVLNSKQKKTCSNACRIKFFESNRKFKIPSKKDLFKMLSNMSPEKIAKIYGVSGNAVRKWIKKYNN